MAKGDARYARCWVDWPMDPRCLGLKGAATKWLDHCLWLLAVKERRETLPAFYDTRDRTGPPVRGAEAPTGASGLTAAAGGPLRFIGRCSDGIPQVGGVTRRYGGAMGPTWGTCPLPLYLVVVALLIKRKTLARREMWGSPEKGLTGGGPCAKMLVDTGRKP